MTAQKTQHSASSTQRFTEIQEISQNIVVFSGSTACMVVEVAAINFSLLSRDEQDARVSAYASFLNSLSFPIQILAINKRVDITSYIELLNSQIKTMTNSKVADYMNKYRQFVETLVKQNVVLDKKFYIVVYYSYLEQGAAKTVASGGKSASSDFASTAYLALRAKTEGVRGQLERMNLPTRILEDQQLIDLFASLYGENLNTDDELLKPNT